MRIKRFAFFLSTFLIPLSLAATGLAEVDSTALPKLTEFTQAANEDPTLGAIHWISSVLQENNSRYYEGMSVCQRLIFNGVDSTPGDTHALTFSVDVTKGGIHAYDFLTSWDNAIPAADSIAPGLNLLVDLFADQCQPDFWSCSQAICDHIHSLGLYDEADLTVLDMDTLAGDDVQLRVDNYDTYFGIPRTVKIWGNQAVSSASITFDGYTGSADDKTANYTLYWTSASDTLIIEMAGHLAVGNDPLNAGIGYGQGRGAANISGGPYHFKLSYLDDKSLGSQDNQIKGADVLLPDLECDVTPSSDEVCVGFDATFTDHSTGGTTPYSWVWTKPPDATVLSTDSILTISSATLADSGEYRVIVTDSSGLADTCYAYLTVHPQPACSITGDSTVCEGFTTEFCATSGMAGYSWSGPGGFSANTQCTGQIGTAGYYQVIITNANGCADTCGRTLVVNAPPVCSITGDSAVCEGFTTEFCATSGMASYSWSGPGGFSANTQCTGQIGVGGYYKVIITDAHACVDSCGRTLVVNPRPVITAPDTVEFDLCDTATVCIDITLYDLDDELIISVNPPGQFNESDSSICFFADRDTTYPFTIIATDTCANSDTAYAIAVVNFNDPPDVNSPDTVEYFLSEPCTCCFDITLDDPDDGLTVTVSPPGQFNPSDSSICFFADRDTTYHFTIIVTDECGTPPAPVGGIGQSSGSTSSADTSYTVAIVHFNDAPVITAPDTVEYYVCDTATVCFDITLYDPDDGLNVSVNPPGQYNPSDSSVCFLADRDTTYNFTIIATDSCGASDTAYTVAVVHYDDPPWITSPDTAIFDLCEPDTVCFRITLSDPDDHLTIYVKPPGWYDTCQFATGVCFFAYTDTTYYLMAVVTDSCGRADTTYTTAIVNMNDPPVITAPDSVEYNLCDTATVCFDITLYDPDDGLNVSVNPPGQFNSSDSSICFFADRDTTYYFTMIVTDTCGATDTAYTKAKVKFNDPPVVIVPSDTSLFQCEPESLCFTVQATDPDAGDTIILEKIEGPGVFAPDTGLSPLSDPICFLPDNVDSTYRLIFRVTNHCGATDEDTFYVTVDLNEPPTVVVPPDTSIFFCSHPKSVCFDISIFDPDNSVNVSVNSPPWYYESADTSVCLFPSTEMTYCCTVIVTDSCQAADTGIFCVTIDFNEPPTVSVPSDTSVFLCEPETLCFPIGFSDPENSIDTIIVNPPWYYNSVDTSVCVFASSEMTYCCTVIVVDSCQAADTGSFCLTVDLNDLPTILLPADTSVLLCGAETLCFPIGFSDPENSIDTIVVNPPWYYNSVDTSVCVFASSEMTYCCTAIVIDSCQAADTGFFCLTVDMNGQPQVIVPPDTSLFQCEPESLCFTVQATDPDAGDTIILEKIEGPGVFAPDTGVSPLSDPICFLPDNVDFTYRFIFRVTNHCGATDEDTFYVTVDLNQPPVVVVPPHVSVFLCEPETLCFDMGISDPDDQVNVSVNPPWSYDPQDTTLCLYAAIESTFCCTVIVTDSCGMADTGIFCVTVEANEPPVVLVPADTSVFLCEPDTLCFDIELQDPDDHLSVSVNSPWYYNSDDTSVCFFAALEATYCCTVIVTDSCGMADTGIFCVTIDLNDPPTVEVPSDTSIFLCEPQTVCFDISISDPDNPVSVSVNSPWYYNSADTSVCVLASAEITYCCTVVVTDSCQETDTGIFCVTVDLNEPPQVIAPATVNFELCGPGNVCFDIELIDPDDGLDVQVSSSFTYNPSGPSVCFFAAEEGTYCCTTVVADSCGLADTAITCLVIDFVPCECLINVWIDSVDCVFPGNTVEIPVTLASDRPIGGFKLYIEYDPTVMNFLSVQRGEMIDDFDGYYDDYNHVPMYDFQYFNHRMLPCAQQCETYKIKIVGIADMPDGVINGPLEAGQGELLKLKFLVSRDANLQDLFLPVKFEFDYDFDLKAPSFSDPTGDTLYVDEAWPGETSQPNDNILRIICFYDGGVKICSDAFCWAGDINMNEYPYEIADAVLYANYFLYGMGVFTFDPDIQVLATDVNQDGFTLSMSDFVFLVRIILEDISPKHKLAPSAEMVDVNLVSHGDAVKVATKSSTAIGAGLYVFRHAGEIKDLTLHADMNMRYSDQNGELRVLVYSFEGKSIPAGTNDLFSFQAKEVELVEVNAADFYGQALKSTISTKVLPTEFLLMNNYPNPFNLSTSISFSLPVDSEVGLKIYNIAGQLVKSFAGEYEAGTHTITWDGTNAKGEEVASGIYLYRLVAGDYSCTKKMALMK